MIPLFRGFMKMALKKKNFGSYLSFSSGTLQSIEPQNIDQNTKLGNIYPVVDQKRPIRNASK